MKPMTRAVVAEALEAERRAATYDLASVCPGKKDLPAILGQRSRWLAIRNLAYDQITDDVQNTGGYRRDRVGHGDTPGGGWVSHDDVDNGVNLWRRWAPEQIALEAGLAVFLNRLTEKQREGLRLIFWSRLTYEHAGAYLGIAKAKVLQGRVQPALERLRQMLREAFVDDQEAA